MYLKNSYILHKMNSEVFDDSVENINDRYVINSNPLVNAKYQYIYQEVNWQSIILIYMIIFL